MRNVQKGDRGEEQINRGDARLHPLHGHSAMAVACALAAVPVREVAI